MAKTFYTTGTGAQQTLTNVQDEKIPIYATKAAADADLANLAVGQIVGTKDGSSIGDTVVVRKDVTVTGTSDTIADIHALVNNILTLETGTYAGDFTRTGQAYGNYILTYKVDGTNKSVSGLCTFDAGSQSDSTWQISYLQQGSATPDWVTRNISGVIYKSTFGGETMDTIWDMAQQDNTMRIGYLAYTDTRNPTYQEYQQGYTTFGSQNVEIHAGYFTVVAYSYDGRVYIYDKTNGWSKMLGGTIHLGNISANMTLANLLSLGSQATVEYSTIIPWNDSRNPTYNGSTGENLIVHSANWQVYANTPTGRFYTWSSTNGWTQLNANRSQVSKTVCVPYGGAVYWDTSSSHIDCVTDTKYADGSHHVTGLIGFTALAQGFYLAGAPQHDLSNGNLGWTIGAGADGSTISCLIGYDSNTQQYTCHAWGGVIPSTGTGYAFDFWYNEQ